MASAWRPPRTLLGDWRLWWECPSIDIAYRCNDQLRSLILLPSMTTFAGDLVLVTQEEFLAERQAGIEEPQLTRAFPVPGAPKIDVLQPEFSGRKPITNPIAIELRFFSAPDADIDPGSFRAYYGFLRIDLTKRILKHVRVEKSGLKIENAEIPSGKHRLFLRIADSKERTTERELRFVVE